MGKVARVNEFLKSDKGADDVRADLVIVIAGLGEGPGWALKVDWPVGFCKVIYRGLEQVRARGKDAEDKLYRCWLGKFPHIKTACNILAK